MIKPERQGGVGGWCVSEKGGISRGRVQRENEREGWDSSGLTQGLLGAARRASDNAWLCHRHGDPSLSNKGEFQEERSEKGLRDEAKLKEPESGRLSASYVTADRPGLYSE